MPVAGGTTFTEEQITEGLLSLIAWAGNAAVASKALKAKGLSIYPQTLRGWATDKHKDRYDELREKYAAQLEQNLIHEYRDVARQSVEIQKLALERAQQRLLAGDDQDPSRTAANAARVAQTMTDKMLSLSGRPTSIREDRSLNDILRSLAGKGIIELPDADAQVVPDGHELGVGVADASGD